MKFAYILVPVAAALLAVPASADVWRCGGNAYTNDQAEARAKNCKLMEGGNITIVSGTKVATPPAPVKVAAAPQSTSFQPPVTAPPRIDANEQRTRDADARAILEAELKKAEVRQAQLLKEWNNGEPEKLGPEHRNHQKYLDRVAEIKANIARNENDIAGLRRELGRAAQPSSAAAAK
jgi:hypothetical protein